MRKPATRSSRAPRIGSGASWQPLADHDPERDYLAVVTFFELRSMLGVPRFLWHSRRVRRRLDSGPPGLIGYAFRTRPFRRYWTLSAWESSRHLRDFMRIPPHRPAMASLRAYMARFGAQEWTVPGAELPLTWHEGLRRINPTDAGER